MSQITVLYFAGVREALGVSSEPVALDALRAPTLDALWEHLCARHPKLAPWRPHLRLAVDESFVSDGAHPLLAGQNIALIPPVSGGSDPDGEARARGARLAVTAATLDAAAVEASVMHHGAGAVVTFTGRVRDHTGDRQVERLIYEAYVPMALRKLGEVADLAESRWVGTQVAIHHRHGAMALGEAAVVVSVSSAHRAQAFEACQFVIDTLKQEVPVWKKEISPDGAQWVGKGP